MWIFLSALRHSEPWILNLFERTDDGLQGRQNSFLKKFLSIDLSDDNWYARHGRDAALYVRNGFKVSGLARRKLTKVKWRNRRVRDRWRAVTSNNAALYKHGFNVTWMLAYRLINRDPAFLMNSAKHSFRSVDTSIALAGARKWTLARALLEVLKQYSQMGPATIDRKPCLGYFSRQLNT